MKSTRGSLAAEYITEALLILMKEKKYKDITITEICKKAGVTRMSFYRNYKTKDDILKKWYYSVSEGFLIDAEIEGATFSKEYLVRAFTFLREYKDIFLALYEAGLFYIYVKEQIENYVFIYKKDISDTYRAYFSAGGLYSVFILWLKRGQIESPSELADQLEEYCFERRQV